MNSLGVHALFWTGGWTDLHARRFMEEQLVAAQHAI